MDRTRTLKLALVALGIIWLFLIVINYYIVHKPFAGENALALLNAVGDFFVAGVLFALAAGIGRRLIGRRDYDSALEVLPFEIGLGLGAISFATLVLGLLGWLNPVLFWLLLLLVIFLLRREVYAVWRNLRTLHLATTTRFERALALFCGFCILVGCIIALTPPIAWDAQTYHLVIPKIALEHGRIAAPPDIPYFSFPALVEMLFLAGLVLKGDGVAALLHFGFLLLTLGLMALFAKRYFNAQVAWLACAILLAVPSLVVLATWAYVDVALCFYAFAAIFALLLGREKQNVRWFVLGGAFAGLALGVKYTALIVPVALFVMLVFLDGPAMIRRPGMLLGYCVSAVLFASPWYLRNLFFTGNPVYPFLFGGPNWDSFRAEWFGRFGTGLVNAPWQILTAPWDATIFGTEGAVNYDATIGPLLLLLLPLLVILLFVRSAPSLMRDNAPIKGLVIFALILYLFWLFGIAGSKLLLQTRLLFPAFPVLAILAAVAFERLGVLDVPQFSFQRFVRLVVFLVMGLTSIGYALGFIGSNALAYLTGFESREKFLSRNLGGYYAALQFMDSKLTADARVLFLWEPRSYYARRAVQPDAILDSFAHARFLYHDAAGIESAWRKAGYTHVLLNRQGLDMILATQYDPVGVDDVRVLQELTQSLKQVYGKTAMQIIMHDGKPTVLGASEDAYAIYEIVGGGR